MQPISKFSTNSPSSFEFIRFERYEKPDKRYLGKEIHERNNLSKDDHMSFLDQSSSSTASERLDLRSGVARSLMEDAERTRLAKKGLARFGDEIVLSTGITRQSAPQSLDVLRAAAKATPKDLGALVRYKVALEKALEGINWDLSIFKLLK